MTKPTGSFSPEDIVLGIRYGNSEQWREISLPDLLAEMYQKILDLEAENRRRWWRR